ncbi:MAG: hydroxyacid dehydrogenase, partial [Candidatus Bathyarchaeota archaeon]|nr:hydroxyacid dehydrogenase [Candidatus Bathyarchaeota archaeon]
REIMAASPRLKVIGVHGIGCDHIDLHAAKELGKVVLNTPDALTVSVAEMAIALVLALIKRVITANTATRSGGWNRKYSDLVGVELAGKTVGVIGLGRIGEATAQRLKPFGVDLLYWSRTRKPDAERQIDIQYTDLADLLQRSDIITLHIPGTPETFHIIGECELALMKPDALLVNVSRGNLIDEQALVSALLSGRLAGAALDVFENEPLSLDSPLIGMDNVILTPHLAASSKEALVRMATQIAESVLSVLNGKAADNRIV